MLKVSPRDISSRHVPHPLPHHHHRILMDCPTWTSTPGIPMLTGVLLLTCKIHSIWNDSKWVVSLTWPKPTVTVMVHYHLSGTHTKYVESPDSNGLPCMTLNTGYPPADLCLLTCQNRLHLWRILVCDTIATAQVCCNGWLSLIWDLYKAYYITG